MSPVISSIDSRLHRIVAAQPYALVFATISGAHLYGFPSPDSDYDLRAAHVLPLKRVIGLDMRDETVECSRVIDGLEMDVVSHDVRKFFGLLLKKNGYVLEQLCSPLVVLTTPEHDELKSIARGCITRHHAHHYFGFAETQWKLFLKESPRRVKPLLYVYRVLLTGNWLMRTGEVEANLLTLNRPSGCHASRNSSLASSAARSNRTSRTQTSRCTKPSTTDYEPSCKRHTTPAGFRSRPARRPARR